MGVLGSASARAQLIIDPTFESSVTSLPNASAYEQAVDYAIGQIESLYTNDITINIDVAASPGTSILGDSSTPLYGELSYSQTVSVLQASATDSTDALAYSHLPATDPTGGGDFFFSGAEAQALGLLPSVLTDGQGNPISDGTFTFGAGFSYALDPNNRAVPGEFDFIGIAEHEITEIMGRISLLGLETNSADGHAAYLPFDLFRYTAPGVSGVSNNGAGVYYSLDGGVTDLMDFNDGQNGGDPQDWLGLTNDSFNAFTGPGVENSISAADITTLDVLGYNLATPEPQTWAMLAAGALLLVFVQRRARR